jgi:TonB family protein
MIRALIVALFLAVLVHAAILLFGGVFKFLLINKSVAPEEEIQNVEIVEESKTEEPEKQEVKKVEKIEEPPEEQMPDTTVLEELQKPQQAPALAPTSLADLESALSGIGGDSGFGSGANFASGGVIGGSGAPGSAASVEEMIGGGAGKPRPISSPKPKLPAALRKTGGSITVVVWVGDDGRVKNVEVEKSTEAALEKPTIDAVRRWTFTPATRDGKKVPAKIRQTIQFDNGNA